MLKPISSTDYLTKLRGVSVIKFFATWCGPCKTLGPMIENLSKQYPSVNWFEADCSSANPLAQLFKVSGLPTCIIFKNTNEFGRVVGINVAGVEAEIVRAGARKGPRPGSVRIVNGEIIREGDASPAYARPEAAQHRRPRTPAQERPAGALGAPIARFRRLNWKYGVQLPFVKLEVPLVLILVVLVGVLIGMEATREQTFTTLVYLLCTVAFMGCVRDMQPELWEQHQNAH